MFETESYRKVLLNRATATRPIAEYIENCISSDDETAKHSFHKIMILHWADDDVHLFDMISEYFGSCLIPVNYTAQNVLSTFHTSNLTLILKIIKLDFIFPYRRNMYNIDILFNDKTSVECFESKTTVEDIITGVVSRRFTENFELDLSDIKNDPELRHMHINFYKIGLLAHFKTLMLRMGRHTKLLNLSNNNLTQVPQEILNFFIKGDLVAINLSNNNIALFTELQRVNSRIEKLWLEGNPLCESYDAASYIKQAILRFPRLVELDGIQFNQHGLMLPFYKNFLESPDMKTKLIVENFITQYFLRYDDKRRSTMFVYYKKDVTLTISSNFTDAESNVIPPFLKKNQNCTPIGSNSSCFIKGRSRVLKKLASLPKSMHDLSSFCVDVLLHNPKCLLLVIDGIYKIKQTNNQNSLPNTTDFVSFRRTFLFTIRSYQHNQIYSIQNEMIYITTATQDQIKHYKDPKIESNNTTLVNPDSDDCDAITSAFMHLTQLKDVEAEELLRACDWNIKAALFQFITKLKNNTLNVRKRIDVDDFSDTSSLLDKEID